MNVTERRERFRAVLAGDQCVYPAPVFDGISARIAEYLGFQVGFMTGTVASASLLCAPPDLMLLTSSEFAGQVRRICRASSISLLAIAENGYGNALNVMRTVEELENAGVSALAIEDTALPIGFGGAQEGVRLITPEEGVGKMKAALAARQDSSMVVVGLTHALHIVGILETIRLVKDYEKVGLDGIFLVGATSAEEVEEVHAETKLPLLVDRATGELLSRQFLATNGVRIANPGHLSLLASVKAVYDTLKALRDGESPAALGRMLASKELQAKITRQSQYKEWVKNFVA